MEEVISDVSICNSALIKLGQKGLISSLSDDTDTARLCNNRFAYVRNVVLEAHPWSFATKTIALAQVSDPVTESEWTYMYARPSDLLRIIRGEDWDEVYETVDGYIGSNSEAAKIQYIWKNTNSGTYSYLMSECIAWRLAADLAYAITQSREVQETMMKAYMEELKNARYHDAHKKSPEGLYANTWIDARV